jgi:hypothetical protein
MIPSFCKGGVSFLITLTHRLPSLCSGIVTGSVLLLVNTCLQVGFETSDFIYLRPSPQDADFAFYLPEATMPVNLLRRRSPKRRGWHFGLSDFLPSSMPVAPRILSALAIVEPLVRPRTASRYANVSYRPQADLSERGLGSRKLSVDGFICRHNGALAKPASVLVTLPTGVQ